jgi:hypothetical protein
MICNQARQTSEFFRELHGPGTGLATVIVDATGMGSSGSPPKDARIIR